MNHLYFKYVSLFIIAIIANTYQVFSQNNFNDVDGYTLSSQATVDFKITTLNTEWLSCTINGPSDEDQQLNNFVTLINAVNPDVIALQEVGTSTTYATIDTLVKKLGTTIWAGNIVPWSQDNCSQNQGIIYKKAKVQFISSSLIKNGGSSTYWSGGRYPALYDLSFVVGTSTVSVSLINIHAKAYSDESSYNKRKGASEGLKTLLDGSSYNTRNIILLGDFNDYLVGTQCSTMSDSPYKNFVDDATNYSGVTKSLKDPSYGNKPVIDNIIISNELFTNYVTNSTVRETTATQNIYDYYYTTTDHTPVSSTFRFTVPTGVDNLYENANISLYPNPAYDNVSIKCDVAVEQVSVFSLTGTEMLSSNNVSDKIDVSMLPRGIYIVRIKTVKGNYQQKLLKN